MILLIAVLFALLIACAPAEKNEALVVSVMRPEAGAVFSEDDTIEVKAEASDEDGKVTRVAFLVGGAGLVDVTAPYRVTFKARDFGLGTHTLSARAYDDGGAISSPAEVRFSVERVSTTRYEVSAAVTGAGSVTSDPAGIDCGSICTADFAENTALVLTAVPDSGNVFKGWSGDCSGTGGCELDINADKGVSASFEPTAPGTFKVAVTKTGPGTVTSSPSGINCGNNCALTRAAEVTASFEEASEGLTETFSFIFLPDTQNYVCSVCRDRDPDTDLWNPSIFTAQTKWIADNVETENIAFVANGGDITENASRLEEWQIADAAYGTLDGVVPYSAAPGDHDYYPEEYRDGDTTYYRQFFGTERYADYDWYGGSSPSGLSHYQRFTGGGQDFIQIGLEFEAPGPASDPNSALGWAKAILEANPDTPTILSMHAYLMDGADRRSKESDQEACYLPGSGVGSEPCRDKAGTLDPYASSGEEIFEALVKPYPQVFMVLGAHYHQSDEGNTGPTSDNGEYHQVSVNNAGSEVFEMLANYQDYDNGGDGWLRHIMFIPDGGANGLDRIRVRTYSPTRGDYQPGAASNFAFDLDFAERFGTP